MELLLTGRWMDAGEAHHWGLINEKAPQDRLMLRARELAGNLAEGPPLVYAAMKGGASRVRRCSISAGT